MRRPARRKLDQPPLVARRELDGITPSALRELDAGSPKAASLQGRRNASPCDDTVRSSWRAATSDSCSPTSSSSSSSGGPETVTGPDPSRLTPHIARGTDDLRARLAPPPQGKLRPLPCRIRHLFVGPAVRDGLQSAKISMVTTANTSIVEHRPSTRVPSRLHALARRREGRRRPNVPCSRRRR